MKLLTVTHYAAGHVGGVERVAQELSSRFTARGIDVRWAACGNSTAAPSEVRVVPLSATNWVERLWGIPYPVLGPRGVARLRREVRACDVVHVHDGLSMASALTTGIARAAGKPVVVTQHVGPIHFRRRLPRALMSIGSRVVTQPVLRGCDQVVFVSQAIRRYYEGRCRFAAPPLFIPNGVDRSQFHPVDEPARQEVRERLGFEGDRRVLLFVGRFVERKGIRAVCEAARHLTDHTWVLAGSGPLVPPCQDLPHVRCVGPVDHARLPDYYRAADLLVLPSVGEGFPLVVQEAMACGTPALVSTETALAISGLDGLLVPVEPTAEGVTGGIRTVFAPSFRLDPLRQQVAEYAHREWDWERCADRYLQVFDEVRHRVRSRRKR